MTPLRRALYFSFVVGGLLAVFGLMYATPAHAAVVFQQPDDSSSMSSSGTYVGNGSFTLTASTTISTIDIWVGAGYAFGSYPITLCIDNGPPSCGGGTPSISLFLNNTGTGYPYYEIAGLDSSAGAPLFVSLDISQAYIDGKISTDTLSPGTYYYRLQPAGIGQGAYTKGDGTSMYIVINDGTPTPPSATASTVSIIEPTNGTTTPSTNLDIGVSYTIGDDLATYSTDGSSPIQIGLRFYYQNTNSGATTILFTDYSIATSTGYHTYATTTELLTGDYSVWASLVGDYGTIEPYPGCEPFPPFSTCGTVTNENEFVTSAPVTFSLNYGTFPLLGFYTSSTTSRNGLATTTCSITAIGGCFQNALAFLFYPSPGALNSFASLWEHVRNKPPFGYVTTTIGALKQINASSTPAFSFGTLPLQNELFTPMKTGLAAILWLVFAVAWYKIRLRHLDL